MKPERVLVVTYAPIVSLYSGTPVTINRWRLARRTPITNNRWHTNSFQDVLAQVEQFTNGVVKFRGEK
jgi:hypothetical protein